MLYVKFRNMLHMKICLIPKMSACFGKVIGLSDQQTDVMRYVIITYTNEMAY